MRTVRVQLETTPSTRDHALALEVEEDADGRALVVFYRENGRRTTVDRRELEDSIKFAAGELTQTDGRDR